jgi:Zinc knuckle
MHCNSKPQRTEGHSVNGTGTKHNQMRCYQCGQPGHYSKNCQEKRQNNMGRQSKLFVGLIKHSLNLLSHTGSHKPWILELDSSTSSAATMDEEDRKPAARDNKEMVEDIEFNDYVTVDPTDNLEDINSSIFNSEVSVNENHLKDNNNNDDRPITFAWGHEKLTKTHAEYVAYVMSHWKLHPFCYFCYNCNQQLVKLGQGNNWGCSLCDFLDLSKGNEYGHWEFGECPRCNNIGPETMRCFTCLLNLGNSITFLALKVALKKYVDEPELLTRDEFAIWANCFHYLEE